jgi:hypothetical protein
MIVMISVSAISIRQPSVRGRCFGCGGGDG